MWNQGASFQLTPQDLLSLRVSPIRCNYCKSRGMISSADLKVTDQASLWLAFRFRNLNLPIRKSRIAHNRSRRLPELVLYSHRFAQDWKDLSWSSFVGSLIMTDLRCKSGFINTLHQRSVIARAAAIAQPVAISPIVATPYQRSRWKMS